MYFIATTEDNNLELIDLKAELREGTGKSAAKYLRKNNSIPATLYGPKTEPVNISVNTYKLIEMIRLNGTTGVFINLDIDGNTKRTAMLKDIQMDVFNISYLHADFQEVNLDTKITLTLPVEVSGDSLGVKEGGLLQLIRRELDITCKPVDAPDSIVIDISDLEIGDSVHVESINLGENIEIPHEVNFTVLTVIPPATSSEEEEGLEEVGEEETAESETSEE